MPKILSCASSRLRTWNQHGLILEDLFIIFEGSY